MKILPQFYHTLLEKQLKPQDLIILEMVVWLIQAFKQVKLERLAALYPKPIKYESRRRALQRFFLLPVWSITGLWFPIIEEILKSHEPRNRSQKRKSSKSFKLVIIDRTQWKGINILMVSLGWEKRAIPISWMLLKKKGQSNLEEQKQILEPILWLLKGENYRVVASA